MLDAPPSLSMTRLVRSEDTALRVSSMIASSVSAVLSTTAGQRVAAERTETDHAVLDCFAFF